MDSRMSEGHRASPKGLMEPNLRSLGYPQGCKLMERDTRGGAQGPPPRVGSWVVDTCVFAS